MAKPRVIGISGLIGSGKGSIASYLEASHGYNVISFADPLKDAVSAVFGWDRQLLIGDTQESREFREKPCPFWSNYLGRDWTPRYALQFVGTDLFRYALDIFIWAASLQKRLEAEPDKLFVIPDVRFSNEAVMIRDLGGVLWNVRRNPEPEWLITAETNPAEMPNKYPEVHVSEWSWLKIPFDVVFWNDSNLEDLYHQTERSLT